MREMYRVIYKPDGRVVLEADGPVEELIYLVSVFTGANKHQRYAVSGDPCSDCGGYARYRRGLCVSCHRSRIAAVRSTCELCRGTVRRCLNCRKLLIKDWKLRQRSAGMDARQVRG